MHCRLPISLLKLRTLLLAAAWAAMPFVAPRQMNGQDAAVATLTSGGLNSITIGQNGSFNLTLAITTNFISSGYSVFYQSNNGSSLFQINSRTFLDPIFTEVQIFPIFPMVLNPSNMFDLGATAPDPGTPHPAGSFTLQSVNMSALNAPVGTYTIFLDARSIMTSRTGGGFNDVNIGGATGPVFTVNVVPEPATVGLLIVGGAVGLLVAWKRRQAAA